MLFAANLLFPNPDCITQNIKTVDLHQKIRQMENLLKTLREEILLSRFSLSAI